MVTTIPLLSTSEVTELYEILYERILKIESLKKWYTASLLVFSFPRREEMCWISGKLNFNREEK